MSARDDYPVLSNHALGLLQFVSIDDARSINLALDEIDRLRSVVADLTDIDDRTAEVQQVADSVSRGVLVTKSDLRLLVALANTVEDITEEEAAALNRARFRADPS